MRKNVLQETESRRGKKFIDITQENDFMMNFMEGKKLGSEERMT